MKRALKKVALVVLMSSSTVGITGCDIGIILQIAGGVIAGLAGQVGDPTLQAGLTAIGQGLALSGASQTPSPEGALQNAAVIFAGNQAGFPVGGMTPGQTPPFVGPDGVNPGQVAVNGQVGVNAQFQEAFGRVYAAARQALAAGQARTIQEAVGLASQQTQIADRQVLDAVAQQLAREFQQGPGPVQVGQLPPDLNPGQGDPGLQPLPPPGPIGNPQAPGGAVNINVAGATNLGGVQIGGNVGLTLPIGR